jgi:hypothetical protein
MVSTREMRSRLGRGNDVPGVGLLGPRAPDAFSHEEVDGMDDDGKRALPGPALRLAEPVSVEQARVNAGTLDDEYGFRQRFRSSGPQGLILAFNGQVGNPGWVRARGAYLVALRDALVATGLECSSFVREDGMSLAGPVERRGDRIVPTGSP